MEDVAHIGQGQHRHQIPQDHGSVLRDHGADEAGHADGGQLDDQVHDLHKDLVEAVDDLSGHQALLPSQQHTKAQEQGNNNDLQHGGVSQRLHGVGGEDVHDHGHDALALRRGVGQIGGIQGVEQADARGHVGQDQGQHHGKGGGAHVIDHGLAADGTHLADVLHGNHARGDGKQHNGNDDEFQQVQENIAPGLDVSLGDVHPRAVRQGHQGQARHNAHCQTNEDPECQGQPFLCHAALSFRFSQTKFSTPLPCKTGGGPLTPSVYTLPARFSTPFPHFREIFFCLLPHVPPYLLVRSRNFPVIFASLPLLRLLFRAGTKFSTFDCLRPFIFHNMVNYR